jgi:pyruvate dehydrogenase E1 component
MMETLKAAEILEDKYKVATDVWSITSYKELYKDGNACERWNILHPGAKQRESYVASQLKDAEGVLVAASDYVKALPESISQWMPRPLIALGTDGYGRSESRASLRDFFEVDAKHIVLAALTGLLRDGKIKASEVKKAITDLGIDSESPDPFTA